jgi:hypothetical protein
LGIAEVEEWVDGDESAGVGVVLAGAEVGEAGWVDGAADEAFVGWPDAGRCAAELSEWGEAALGEPPRTFRTATPLRLGVWERKTVAAESEDLLS